MIRWYNESDDNVNDYNDIWPPQDVLQYMKCMLYTLLKHNPSNSVHNWMLYLFGNLILCSFQIYHLCYSSVSLKGFLKPNQKFSIWFECCHLILSLRVVNILFNIGFLNDFLATLKFCQQELKWTSFDFLKITLTVQLNFKV